MEFKRNGTQLPQGSEEYFTGTVRMIIVITRSGSVRWRERDVEPARTPRGTGIRWARRSLSRGLWLVQSEGQQKVRSRSRRCDLGPPKELHWARRDPNDCDEHNIAIQEALDGKV